MSTPDPFTPTNLFAFPLFSTRPAGFEQHKDGLVADILAHKAEHLGMVRSNRKAWHSGDEFLESESEHLAWLLTAALVYGRRALGRYYRDWANSELHLGRFWANVVGPGGWNAPHHHFPAHWSGVFYISMGQMGSGDPHDLDGMIEFLNPTPWQTQWGQSGNFVFGPREGVMLLFPSSLVHFVHPHSCEQDRISVAFNLNVGPRATSPSGV